MAGSTSIGTSPRHLDTGRWISFETHPFDSDSVKFGFSEDMLEHFSQARSIFFLSRNPSDPDSRRVVRLSFPGLEGVLKRHYRRRRQRRVREGELEAHAHWGHVHFYGQGRIAFGRQPSQFTDIRFVDYGRSGIRNIRPGHFGPIRSA